MISTWYKHDLFNTVAFSATDFFLQCVPRLLWVSIIFKNPQGSIGEQLYTREYLHMYRWARKMFRTFLESTLLPISPLSGELK